MNIMKPNKSRSNGKRALFAGIIGLVVIIAIPITLHGVFTDPKADWLQFLGSYLSGAVGAGSTFAAFYFTNKDSELQNDDTRFQISEQNRIAIQPLLTVSSTIEGFREGDPQITLAREDLGLNSDDVPQNFRNRHEIRTITFTNIGQAAAINTLIYYPGNISGESIGHLDRNKSVTFAFLCPFSQDKYNWELKFTYSDIGGQGYSQSVPVECFLEEGPSAMPNNMIIKVGDSTFPKPI